MDRVSRFLLAVAALLMTAQVSAGVIRDDKGDTDWEFIITPYLWAISLDGTSQVGPFPPMDVEADFSDLFDNMNMALAAHMELHRGKWAIVLDPMWAQLEMDMGEGSAEVNISLIELWPRPSVSLANPKSRTFARPSSVTMMFSGFKSR